MDPGFLAKTVNLSNSNTALCAFAIFAARKQVLVPGKGHVEQMLSFITISIFDFHGN